jgi:hypothetical protein
MGLSLNAIGKRLGVSAQSVMRLGQGSCSGSLPKPEPTGRAIVVELDEVWHFIQKACKLWIWKAFERSTEAADRLAMIAVGTLIAERPPHRTVRAVFPHTAPTLGV